MHIQSAVATLVASVTGTGGVVTGVVVGVVVGVATLAVFDACGSMIVVGVGVAKAANAVCDNFVTST
jgi:hypothetical protein